jgi:hypothetical protein
MSTGRTHKDLADNEFGGDSSRWGRGYNWMVKYVDKKCALLIGPDALELWAPQFPYFAETLREYMMRDKEHVDVMAILSMWSIWMDFIFHLTLLTYSVSQTVPSMSYVILGQALLMIKKVLQGKKVGMLSREPFTLDIRGEWRLV